jgi:mandelate racemase
MLTDWPLILIDLYTEEGVIGRSYLEPYIKSAIAVFGAVDPRAAQN